MAHAAHTTMAAISIDETSAVFIAWYLFALPSDL
jgi:hypothetical protein